MITERAVGVCPACNETVKDEDDCSWICRSDLNKSNPYHQFSEYHDEVLSVQEKNGCYSNCPSQHELDGGECVWHHLPMHEVCADGEY